MVRIVLSILFCSGEKERPRFFKQVIGKIFPAHLWSNFLSLIDFFNLFARLKNKGCFLSMIIYMRVSFFVNEIKIYSIRLTDTKYQLFHFFFYLLFNIFLYI